MEGGIRWGLVPLGDSDDNSKLVFEGADGKARRQKKSDFLSSVPAVKDTIEAMAAITNPQDGAAVQVTTTGRAGLFRWQSGDLSAEVAADPDGLVYVPSDDHPSGESGAWRLVDDSAHLTRRIDGQSEAVDVFLIYGQSNAKGYADNTPGDPEYKTPLARMWDGSEFIPLTNYGPSQNDGRSTGGAWVAFANEYAALTGRQMVFANCARGSQSIAELSKGADNTNYSGLIAWHDGVLGALTAEGSAVGRVIVLFNQGEEDQRLATNYTDYLAAISQLWSDLKSDTTATRLAIWPFGTYLSTTIRNGWPVRAAQRMFAQENVDVIVAFDHLEGFLPANGLLNGNAHYTQRGYNIMGRAGAETVARWLYDQEPSESLEIVKLNGHIQMSGFQRWQMAAVTLKKGSAGTWSWSNTAGNTGSLIVAVDESDPNQLRLILPQPCTQVLTYHATPEGVSGMRPITPLIGSPYNADEEAVAFIPIKFRFDGTARLRLAEKTLDFANLGVGYNSALSAAFTAAYPSAGRAVISTPTQYGLPVAAVRGGAAATVRVSNNQSETSVWAYDASGALINDECAVRFEYVDLPHADVPVGFEFSVMLIFATYRNAQV